MNKQYYAMMEEDYDSQEGNFIRSSVTKSYNSENEYGKRKEKRDTLALNRQRNAKRGNWE